MQIMKASELSEALKNMKIGACNILPVDTEASEAI